MKLKYNSAQLILAGCLCAAHFVTVSCGSIETSNATAASGNEPTALRVAETYELPECNGGGELYYVYNEKSFYVCAPNGWETIDLKGEDGADGADAPVDNLVLNKGFYCPMGDKNLDQNPSNYSSYGMGSQVVQFSDGSYSLTCGSNTGSYADLVVHSNVSFYFPNSVAISEGYLLCITWGVSTKYYIDSNTVEYFNNGNDSLTETLNCKQIN
jgi:hypothetical protein